MITLVRTDAENKDFKALVGLLDAELRQRDGEDHAFYAQFNSLERIRHVVLAYQNGEPVGCGAIRKFDSRIAEIKRMFVSTSSRGKGIARSILNELETWAQELDFHACILETGFNQPEAITLYQKTGYTRIPNYGPYTVISGSLCMTKRLASRTNV